ncbi:hypothetical protein GIB67_028436 [Kingdonia uniflora]|uniref:NAD(P)-binding domain-containing protein n=1 Tax=Kingdonia uniflora TaxID=39325 RepID=A0A7J7P1T3_9MAGN|nr:hypothetical protein GIB67_028436 [Kingdonia uniflora]
MINNSNRQEAQPKKTNTTPKPIPRVEQLKQVDEWGIADLFSSDEPAYAIGEEIFSDSKIVGFGEGETIQKHTIGIIGVLASLAGVVGQEVYSEGSSVFGLELMKSRKHGIETAIFENLATNGVVQIVHGTIGEGFRARGRLESGMSSLGFPEANQRRVGTSRGKNGICHGAYGIGEGMIQINQGMGRGTVGTNNDMPLVRSCAGHVPHQIKPTGNRVQVINPYGETRAQSIYLRLLPTVTTTYFLPATSTMATTTSSLTNPPSPVKKCIQHTVSKSTRDPATPQSKQIVIGPNAIIPTMGINEGEDLIRESEIPYTIIRPCALTEEPAGADLIFEQGDNITGKISREEVAHICVAALESPYACDKTFEVKSVVPFSEPFTVDQENPPREKNYEIYFKTLKDGINGKEVLEQSPVMV